MFDLALHSIRHCLICRCILYGNVGLVLHSIRQCLIWRCKCFIIESLYTLGSYALLSKTREKIQHLNNYFRLHTFLSIRPCVCMSHFHIFQFFYQEIPYFFVICDFAQSIFIGLFINFGVYGCVLFSWHVAQWALVMSLIMFFFFIEIFTFSFIIVHLVLIHSYTLPLLWLTFSHFSLFLVKNINKAFLLFLQC